MLLVLYSCVMNIQPCDEIGLPSPDGFFCDMVFPNLCDCSQAVLGDFMICSGFYGLFFELLFYDLVSGTYGQCL